MNVYIPYANIFITLQYNEKSMHNIKVHMEKVTF